jgi:hypothetical protein
MQYVANPGEVGRKKSKIPDSALYVVRISHLQQQQHKK